MTSVPSKIYSYSVSRATNQQSSFQGGILVGHKPIRTFNTFSSKVWFTTISYHLGIFILVYIRTNINVLTANIKKNNQNYSLPRIGIFCDVLHIFHSPLCHNHFFYFHLFTIVEKHWLWLLKDSGNCRYHFKKKARNHYIAAVLSGHSFMYKLWSCSKTCT